MRHKPGIFLVIIFTLITINCTPKAPEQLDEDPVKDSEPVIIQEDSDAEVGETESVVEVEDTIIQFTVPGWPEYVPFMPESILMENTVSGEGYPSLILELPQIPHDIRDYYKEELQKWGWTEVPSEFGTRDRDGFGATYEREGDTLQLMSRPIPTGSQLAMILMPGDAE